MRRETFNRSPPGFNQFAKCFPREVVQKMGELGLMGLAIPEEYGGAGADQIAYTMAIEELARVSASVAAGELAR